MRFALLGEHPDGIDFARALTDSGRHQLAVYSGSAAGVERLRRHGLSPRCVGELEEVLADPDIDAVIVASSLAVRRAQLLRALQSERHVLCVHPADATADVAYEAGLVQADTGCVLLPLLPMPLHPSVGFLRNLAQTGPAPRLLEMEVWSTDEILLELSDANHKPGFPGWDVLRALGGEIGEIYAQSTKAEIEPGEPIVVSGRFVGGLLFQLRLLPNQSESQWRLALVTSVGRSSLEFARGWPGPARLTWIDERGQPRVDSWETENPWLAMLERFEQAVLDASIKKPQPGQPAEECLTKHPPQLGWEDELRALELDDGARRSLEKGRSSTLDLQEATEDATFKGTMTLVGCSLIWLSVIVLILSFWIPWLAWGIVPVFGLFLVLQALRWALPEKTREGNAPPPASHARG